MKYLILLGILFFSYVHAEVFEIIQSVPQGTTLEIPGIRHAKDVWPEMMASAKKSIELEMFYATNDANSINDPALDLVTNEIIKASKRGVKVKLIVDSKFFEQKANQVIPLQLAALNNVEVKVINFTKLTGGIQHAKYFIIDQKESFIGSHNYDWRALTQIHEVGLRSDHPKILSGLLNIFKMDWNLASYPNKPMNTKKFKIQKIKKINNFNSDVTFLSSPEQLNPENHKSTISAFISEIETAQKSIKLQTYDYAIHLFGKSDEWNILQEALIKAAKRGIKVQLLVDQKSLKKETPALLALKSNGVEVKAMYIPDLESGPIPYARLVHSKYIVFDDKTAWIGTENLSGSYFLDSRNVGVLFTNLQAITDLNQIFYKAWESQYAKQIN